MVLQDRDLRLLREIAEMRVVDREQAKIVGGFNSTRRINFRLLALTRAGLLRRFFLGTRSGGTKALYAVSPKAAQYIGVPAHGLHRRRDEVLTGEYFVEHQLQVNLVYYALKHPSDHDPGKYAVSWQSLFEPVAPHIGLIPDGYFEVKTPEKQFAAFLEVDLGNEALRIWKQKIDAYLLYATSGEFERRFQQNRFRVLVVANSEGRIESLRKFTASVTDKVFWFATLEAVNHEGLWARIWSRPTDENRKTLFD